MLIATKIIATLVALEFLYIMYLETFATTSASTSRVFGMSAEEFARLTVNTLFKNQGVYNGPIAVLILVAAFAFGSVVAIACLMVFVVLVAIGGGHHEQPLHHP